MIGKVSGIDFHQRFSKIKGLSSLLVIDHHEFSQPAICYLARYHLSQQLGILLDL